jgi:hypothetical protein
VLVADGAESVAVAGDVGVNVGGTHSVSVGNRGIAVRVGANGVAVAKTSGRMVKVGGASLPQATTSSTKVTRIIQRHLYIAIPSSINSFDGIVLWFAHRANKSLTDGYGRLQ